MMKARLLFVTLIIIACWANDKALTAWQVDLTFAIIITSAMILYWTKNEINPKRKKVHNES